MLGAYGPWAAGLVADAPASHSWRNPTWTNIDEWRSAARQQLADCLAMPDTGSTPTVTVERQYVYDGLHMEELSWQLPYGPRTQALFLKPLDAPAKLPGIVALHDHGGNKFFGWQKITRSRDELHPRLAQHLQYYEGVGWANEVAKRGYAVLAPDAHAFGSRRVRLADVPDAIRNGLNDADWQADWAIEIDRGRLALDGSLVDAINALTRAQQALATLTSRSSRITVGFVSAPMNRPSSRLPSAVILNTRLSGRFCWRTVRALTRPSASSRSSSR